MFRKVTYILNVGVDEQNNSAAVNRCRAFKKGLESNGIKSKVFFPHSKAYRNRYKAKIMALISIIKYFIMSKKNDVIVFYGDTLFVFLAFFFKWKLTFVVERNEYPYYMINANFSKNSYSSLFYNKFIKYIDGFITCSQSLKEFYKPILHKNLPVHISPLIINIGDFVKEIEIKENKISYIGYCGSLGNNKDGVPDLIKAFSLIAEEYPNLELHIAGSGNDKILEELYALVVNLKLDGRVRFIGNLPHNKMASFLANANLLALARPNNKQAEGGFPSKIGEYMSVKVPIIVTNVGEIHHYLRDNYNCFMAEADSIESFASKMIEALECENVNLIVQRAFETVKQFDSTKQAKLLIEYLKYL